MTKRLIRLEEEKERKETSRANGGHLLVIKESPLVVLFNVADVVAVVGVTANVTDDGHQGVLPCSHSNEIREQTVIRSNAVETSDILTDVQLDGCTADRSHEFMNKWNKRQTARERERERKRERKRERERERERERKRQRGTADLHHRQQKSLMRLKV
jgi:hypothetical protein